jgi:hypothetical protein
MRNIERVSNLQCRQLVEKQEDKDEAQEGGTGPTPI